MTPLKGVNHSQWHKWQKYWRRYCRTLSRAQSLAALRLLDVLSLGLLDVLSLFLGLLHSVTLPHLPQLLYVCL